MVTNKCLFIPGVFCFLSLAGIILVLSFKAKSADGSADRIVLAGSPARQSATGGTQQDSTIRYLALGDSYTIGQSVARNDRYPAQVVSRLRASGYPFADAEIIATSGWTTANLWAVLKAKPLSLRYNVVTLLVGVNNQFRGLSRNEYRIQFAALLARCIRLTGNVPGHVIVLSIPDYAATPFAAALDRGKITREIDLFNAVNREVAASRKVHYLNITAESRKAGSDRTLVAPDGLHYSAKEYKVWTDLLAPVMEEAITE